MPVHMTINRVELERTRSPLCWPLRLPTDDELVADGIEDADEGRRSPTSEKDKKRKKKAAKT